MNKKRRYKDAEIRFRKYENGFPLDDGPQSKQRAHDSILAEAFTISLVYSDALVDLAGRSPSYQSDHVLLAREYM